MHRKTEETHEDEDQHETSPTPGRPLRNLAFRRTFPNSKRNGANLVRIYLALPRKKLGISDSEESRRCVPGVGRGLSVTPLCPRVGLRGRLPGGLSTI